MRWELYNIEKDYSQAEDLAVKHPEKLRQVQDLWWAEAARYNIFPLDTRRTEHFDVRNRPSLTAGRTTFTYYPGMVRLPEGSAPDVKNKSFSVTAEVAVPEKGLKVFWSLKAGARRAGAFTCRTASSFICTTLLARNASR